MKLFVFVNLLESKIHVFFFRHVAVSFRKQCFGDLVTHLYGFSVCEDVL